MRQSCFVLMFVMFVPPAVTSRICVFLTQGVFYVLRVILTIIIYRFPKQQPIGLCNGYKLCSL